MKRVAIAAAVLLAACAAHRAAEAPQEPPTALELARFIMPQENWRRVMDAVGAQFRKSGNMAFEAETRKRGVTLPAGCFDRLLGLDPGTLVTYDESLAAVAATYEKHFTPVEMNDLLAFYRTPVGRKTIDLQAQLVQEVSGRLSSSIQERVLTWSERAQADAVRCVEDHLAKQSGGAR
jgi:hypothetical protein